MSLPSELISEFVKATKDTGTNGSVGESIVYGTTVMNAGTMFVQLDGSDGQLTPISDTTNITAGERVSVLIKNHSATIINNLAYPSAKSAGESATNFMYYDPEYGVEVGDKTGGIWKGCRTRMASDAFYILDENSDILAKYGKNIIELANAFTLEYTGTRAIIGTVGDEGLGMLASDILLYALNEQTTEYPHGGLNSVSITDDVLISSVRHGENFFDSGEQSFIRVSPDKIELGGNVYVNEQSLIDLMHPVGKVEMFTITTNPSELYPGTTWERLEGVFPFATGVDEMVGTMSQSLLVSEGEGQVRHLYVAMWKRTA